MGGSTVGKRRLHDLINDKGHSQGYIAVMSVADEIVWETSCTNG